MLGFLPDLIITMHVWLSSRNSKCIGRLRILSHISRAGNAIVRIAALAATISLSGVENEVLVCLMHLADSGNRVLGPAKNKIAPDVDL